mgnify:CR=1 FL=1
MKIEIRTRPLKDGNRSIYLDFYEKGKRRYEYLQLYLVPETDALAKAQNKNAMDKAIEIRAKRLLGETPQKEGEENPSGDIRISDWMARFIERQKGLMSLSKGYIRHLSAIKQFMDIYLAYINKPDLKMSDFDKGFYVGFIDYLTNVYVSTNHPNNIRGLGKGSLYTYQCKLNTILNEAVREDVIKCNPYQFIEPSVKLKKPKDNRDFLTKDELQAMITAKTGTPNVKKAFVFCCYTGLRYSEISVLTWGNIQMTPLGLSVHIDAVKKTSTPLDVPLGRYALKWLPERNGAKDTDIVFPMPNAGACNRALKIMAKNAGIKKRVCYHTSRHTFATLALSATKDVATVSKLLNHSDIATTQIYAEVLMDDKIAAVNKLHNLF